MNKKELKTVKKKMKAIHANERKIADSISHNIIQMPGLTVWEILIPIMFIFKLAQINQVRDNLIQNQMFTKNLALKAALDLVTGHSKNQVIDQIKDSTSSLLTSANSGLYSETIREKQLNEINLLLDHYVLLLKANGIDYKTMVKNAYVTRDRFEAFLNQLKQAEAETTQAAKKTLGDRADAGKVILIESVTNKKRRTVTDKIFQPRMGPKPA
jgi:hypothetical protein